MSWWVMFCLFWGCWLIWSGRLVGVWCDEPLGLLGGFRGRVGCAVFAREGFARRKFRLWNAPPWGVSRNSWWQSHEVEAESCQCHTAIYICPVIEPTAGLVAIVVVGEGWEPEQMEYVVS